MKYFQIISYDEKPFLKKWSLKTLYKEQSNGRVRFFRIFFENGFLKTEFGLIDGKVQESSMEIKENNSKRTIQEQALLQAKAKYKEKIENDGFLPSDVEKVEIDLPMKADKYSQSKFPEKLFPVCVQPKLDGIRIIAKKICDKVILKTNGSNEIIHFEKIKEQIKKLLDIMPIGTRLDGEFYNKEIKFENLNSIVRTTLQNHPDEDKIIYNIFDLKYSNFSPFEIRYKLLTQKYNSIKDEIPNIVIIQTIWNVKNHEEILELHDKFKNEDYEGIMIRFQINNFKEGTKEYERTFYKDGRNNHLYKYKEFLDDEGIVVNIRDGKGKFVHQAILEVDYNGTKLSMTSPGTEKEKREIFQNKENYIGKYITFKYQETTENGIPRFPVALRFRDKETID